jgi:hypothetical protein
MADQDFIIKKGLVLRNLEGNDGKFLRLDPNGKTEVSTVSESTVEDISANYAPISLVEDISGNLQTQIDNQSTLIDDNADEISALQVEVDSISANVISNTSSIEDLNTEISDVSAASWAIDQSLEISIINNASDITSLQTNVDDLSAAASVQVSAADVWYTPDNPLFFYNRGTPDNLQDAVDRVANNSFAAYGTSVVHASTGVISGGVISTASSTEIRISAGFGNIYDHADLDLAGVPEVNAVFWNEIVTEVPNMTAGDFSFVSIDDNGDVNFSQSFVEPEDYRDRIVLGKVIHRTGNVQFVINLHQIDRDVHGQFSDLAQAIGTLNINGNVYSPSDPNTDLSLKKSGGHSFRFNYNSYIDIKNPHDTTESPVDPITFTYIYRDGSGNFTYSFNETEVDPDNWDDGSGTLQTLSTSAEQFSIQRIYMFPGSNNSYLFYGRDTYASISEALDGIDTEEFVEIPGNFQDASFRAYLIVKRGITDFSDTTTWTIIDTGKFGEGGGSSAGAAATSQFSDSTFSIFYNAQPDKNLTFDLSNLNAAGEEIVIKANADQAGDIDLTLPAETGTIALLSDISASERVISLNGLQDDVNIVGAGTVTVLTQGDTITISGEPYDVNERHNDLLEIQGGISGDPGEYYHLSEAQFNDYIGKTEVISISGDLQQQIDELAETSPISGSFGDVFSFTQGDLVSGILDLEHNIDEQFVQVQIYDNNDQIINPDHIEAIDSNNVRITLDSFAPITGTWRAVIHASRFRLDPTFIEEFKYAETVTTIDSTQTTSIDYGIFAFELSGSDVTLTIPDADQDNDSQVIRFFVAENPNAKTVKVKTTSNQEIGTVTEQEIIKESKGFSVVSYKNKWSIIQDSRSSRKFVFQSPELDSPNNSDWAVNSLAPAAADSTNSAIIVRTFDDTTEEGVGLNFSLTETSKIIRISLISKAGSAQTGNVIPV